MRNLSIFKRTAFFIAFLAFSTAAVAGCGKTNTAGTASAQDSSASGITAKEVSETAYGASTGDQVSSAFSSAFPDTDSRPAASEEGLAVGPLDASSSSATGAEASFAEEIALPSAAPAGNAADQTQTSAADADGMGTPANTSPNKPALAPPMEESGNTAAGPATGPSTPGASPADGNSNSAKPSNEKVAAAIQDGIPERNGKDTALKESVLSQALVEGTGWGQSAGSSLHAASAATRLLAWSNLAGAGKADKEALTKAVQEEYNRLSPEQRENLQNNWSFITYDVETMLDSFSDLEGPLTDAGCLEAARDAASDQNVLLNWKAAYDAIESAISKQ